MPLGGAPAGRPPARSGSRPCDGLVVGHARRLAEDGVGRMERAGRRLRDGLAAQAVSHRLVVNQTGPVQMPVLTFAETSTFDPDGVSALQLSPCQRFVHHQAAIPASWRSEIRYGGSVLERHLLRVAQESLRTFRVTVINGPRQSGKTTLARQLVADAGSYWSFDDESVRAAAGLDPHGFVEAGRAPMAIDEVQRGGNDVVLAIKSVVDQRTARGQFVLAGSTRFLSVPQLSESLAGRAEILDLWPFSQGELLGVTETFLDTLLTHAERLPQRRCEHIDRNVLFARLIRGGYPELIEASPHYAARWYRNYVRTVVERDVVEASAITQAEELPTLLRLIAANSSGELVTSRLANDAGMTVDTATRYIALLELVGFVVRIRAWTPSLTTREKRHPKMMLSDTGLACGLLGRNTVGLGAPTSALTGPLLESFVTMELVKQRGWSQVQPAIRHWRDRNGAEVDLIIEDDDGSVAGIEVKASSTVAHSDARHLGVLRDKLGDRFLGGVVLYLGERALPLGERIWALPISVLWSD